MRFRETSGLAKFHKEATAAGVRRTRAKAPSRYPDLRHSFPVSIRRAVAVCGDEWAKWGQSYPAIRRCAEMLKEADAKDYAVMKFRTKLSAIALVRVA